MTMAGGGGRGRRDDRRPGRRRRRWLWAAAARNAAPEPRQAASKSHRWLAGDDDSWRQRRLLMKRCRRHGKHADRRACHSGRGRLQPRAAQAARTSHRLATRCHRVPVDDSCWQKIACRWRAGSSRRFRASCSDRARGHRLGGPPWWVARKSHRQVASRCHRHPCGNGQQAGNLQQPSSTSHLPISRNSLAARTMVREVGGEGQVRRAACGWRERRRCTAYVRRARRFRDPSLFTDGGY